MKLNLLLVSAVAFATLSFNAKAVSITEVNDETLFNAAVDDQVVDNFNAAPPLPGKPLSNMPMTLSRTPTRLARFPTFLWDHHQTTP